LPIKDSWIRGGKADPYVVLRKGHGEVLLESRRASDSSRFQSPENTWAKKTVQNTASWVYNGKNQYEKNALDPKWPTIIVPLGQQPACDYCDFTKPCALTPKFRTSAYVSDGVTCIHQVPIHLASRPGINVEKNHCADHASDILVYTSISKYIVYTNIRCVMQSHTTLYFESGLIRLATPTGLSTTLLPCLACIGLPHCCPIDCPPSYAGPSAPKLPQPRVDFIDIAAPPSVCSCCIGASKREA
jgi:hypothetical protein